MRAELVIIGQATHLEAAARDIDHHHAVGDPRQRVTQFWV
jgi:hypothetical protein